MIGSIISKNLKILIRSKTSALVVVLGPLLLILLVGLAFNSSGLNDVRLGVYTSAHSDLTNSVLEQLKTKFSVYELETQDNCINGVKAGEFNVCAVFPPDLKVTTSDNIIFYVDYSRMNLVYNIIDTVSSQLEIKSTALSKEMTGNILTRLENARVSLVEKKSALEAASSNTNEIKNSLTEMSTSFKGLELMDMENISLEFKENNLTGTYATSIKNTLEETQDILKTSTTKITELEGVATQSQEDLSSLTTVVTNIINSVSGIEVKDAENIVSPIKTKIEPITTQGANLNYLFPTLLVLIVMFVSMLLSSTSLINEKTTYAYFRNFITPTSDFIFLLGNFFSYWIIVLIELLVIVVASLFFFSQSFLLAALFAFLILALSSVVFILIGMIIGYSFKSSETSNLASISIASVLLFFSNTILPLESLPSWVRDIILFVNPFVLTESALKKVILFGSPIKDQWPAFLILVGFAFILGFFAYVANQATKRRL
ncbi:MAG: ABC transporter permease [Candidatus Nanoarchaeia archaeon]|nr:ABC transporter permease [Candidatus Nanoarchaeia archaeon]MDD5587515.1 ABC transporter permease [Candidatus Nanoarchaeia archaeon]